MGDPKFEVNYHDYELLQKIKKGEIVTLTKEDYDSLKDDELWLMCLNSAGVDNWPGIDFAYELKQEES